MKYQLISMAVVLRDYIEVSYIDDDQKMLVDIADGLFNAGTPIEAMNIEARIAYDSKPKAFWTLVEADFKALDSQICSYNVKDLIADYEDLKANQ